MPAGDFVRDVRRLDQRAIAETDRRRNKQIQYNAEHGITPRSIIKAFADVMEGAREVQGTNAMDPAATLLCWPRTAAGRIKQVEMTNWRATSSSNRRAVRDEIQKLRASAFGLPSTRAG